MIIIIIVSMLIMLVMMTIIIIVMIIMIAITSSDARWLPMGADGVGALEAEMTRVAGNLIITIYIFIINLIIIFVISIINLIITILIFVIKIISVSVIFIIKIIITILIKIITRARLGLGPPLHPMRLPNPASPHSQQVARYRVVF